MIGKIFAAAGLMVGLTTMANAAPPDVTSLFPSGAQQGTTVSVTIQGKLGDGATRVWSSRPGVTVALPEKPGPISIQISAQTEPGICWLRFFNDDGASGLRPFVIGTCHEINEQEPNDDVVKAQPLPELPVVVNGQHNKNGDADSYAIPLRKGQVLVASLMANRTLGSPQDAVLQVLGPSGFVVEQNEDDQGFDPQLAFAAPSDGIYTIRTWAFPATPDSSIRLFGSAACVYRLLVTTGPFVERTDPMSVEGGLSQSIRLHGWNQSQQPLDVTPPVSAIQRRFEWPLEGLSHRLPTTILVQPFSAISEVEPNNLAQPQRVTPPVGITGGITQSRDVDTYVFAARKGQRLRFEVLARDVGSPLDPVLKLHDSAGQLLKEADDDGKQSADPEFEFAVPADGDFRISVSDRFLHHGDRYMYLLSITEPQPDFSVSIADDTLVLAGGKELEIPLTIARSGFADEIQFHVNGLPSAVTVVPAKSEPKGDSSKAVKLKLKSDGQMTFSGPIQIVGRPGNGPITAERTAVVPLKAFQAESPWLWLTVKK